MEIMRCLIIYSKTLGATLCSDNWDKMYVAVLQKHPNLH